LDLFLGFLCMAISATNLQPWPVKRFQCELLDFCDRLEIDSWCEPRDRAQAHVIAAGEFRQRRALPRRRRASAFCAAVNRGGRPMCCPRFCARLRPSAVRPPIGGQSPRPIRQLTGITGEIYRSKFDWLVTGQVVPINPAGSVRGPRHVVTSGQTPVLDPAEARAPLDITAAFSPNLRIR
jgi:hypothetical protein